MSYSMAPSKFGPEPKQKSMQEHMGETVVYAAIACVLYTIIAGLVKIIITPFKILFTSDTERLAHELEVAEDKVKARIGRRRFLELSDSNMFNQYIKRFKTETATYKNDPNNQVYADWYDAWKKGTLLDPELQWSPEIFVDDCENENAWNNDFLDYLSRQVDLHLQQSFSVQSKLVMTIRKHYPEFTPNLSLIKAEIAEYREKALESNLKNELVEELTKKGVSDYEALQLIKECDSAEEIKEKLSDKQKASEYQMSVTAYKFMIENELSFGGDQPKCFQIIIDEMQNMPLAQALVNGDIKAQAFYDKFESLCKWYKSEKCINLSIWDSDEDRMRAMRTELMDWLEITLKEQVMKGC